MTTISFKSGVYKITNTLSGRFYFGSSMNLKRRKAQHLSDLKNNKHKNQFMQNDFNKSGMCAFHFEIVKYCTKEEMIKEEQVFLDRFWDKKTLCYNIRMKADVPNLSTIEKLKQHNFGENNPFYGKHGILNPNSKKIFQFNTLGKLIGVHFGCVEAAENTNGNSCSINLCCNGKIKKSGGFHWSYTSEFFPKKNKRPERKSRFIYSPNKQVFEVKNLKLFCEQHNLNYSSMMGVVCGNRKSCHGWSIEK